MNPKDYNNSDAGQPVRTLQGYWAFTPNTLPPNINWSSALVSALSKAERALARLDSVGGNFASECLATRAFVRREAVLSSTIEGTRATLEDLFKYEAVQMSFLESHSDAKEVYNYARALEYGIKRLESLPISLRLIKEIHGKLMEDVIGERATAGEFRHSQNWIGPAGSTLDNAPYVPPTVSNMQVSLDQLEKFVHTDSEIPALVRIGLVHYQFEAIHPFIDGNGRVGRLLIALLMQDWQLLSEPALYFSAYFEAQRQDYYDGLLAVSQEGDWEGWLLYFLEGVRRQSLEATARQEELAVLRKELMARVQGERSFRSLAAVIEFLLGNPITSVRQVQIGIKVNSFKSAQRSVQKLESLGTVREITGRARGRLYQADEILEVINRVGSDK